MDVLSRADLLTRVAEAPEVKTVVVPCPELGGALRVRRLTGTARSMLEAAYAAIQMGADGKVMDPAIVRVVSDCVVDDKGHPILPLHQAEKLFKHYPDVAFRVRDAAVEMAGMTEEDKEALKENFG